MEGEKDRNSFFITAGAARLAYARLVKAKVHPHFPGYLAAVATAASEKKTAGIRVGFKKFYDEYLLASGAPPAKPYVQPFPESLKPGAQLFNSNVAGSYSPSSIRPDAPLRAVIEYDGRGRSITHTLRPDHEQLALEHLTKNRVPVHALATFFLRDHAIDRGHAKAEPDTVVQKFCATLGYDLDIEEARRRFEILYELDSSMFDGIQYAEDVS